MRTKRKKYPVLDKGPLILKVILGCTEMPVMLLTPIGKMKAMEIVQFEKAEH